MYYCKTSPSNSRRESTPGYLRFLTGKEIQELADKGVTTSEVETHAVFGKILYKVSRSVLERLKVVDIRTLSEPLQTKVSHLVGKVLLGTDTAETESPELLEQECFSLN